MRANHVLLMVVLAAVVSIDSRAADEPPSIPTKDIAPSSSPASITIAAMSEPGDRMTVTGRLLGGGGQGVSAASMFVYQTDANGHYDPNETKPNGDARLRGFIRTGRNGEYRFRTIRPAPYPNREIPAHFHYEIKASGYKDVFVEMWFDDDPKITDKYREFASNSGTPYYGAPYYYTICHVTRDAQRVWRCTADIQLQPD